MSAAPSTNNVQAWLQHLGLSAALVNDTPANIAEWNVLVAQRRPRCSKPGGGWDGYCMACLLARRLVYFKNQPGDCGTKTPVNFGAGVTAAKVGSYASLGAGTAAGGVAIAETAGALTAGTAGTVALAATGIGLAVLPFTIWGMFSAHHAAAVANEQANNCAVATALNQALAAADQANAKGISFQTLKSSLEQVRAAALKQVGLTAKGGTCDWSVGAEGVINALIDQREWLYQQGASGSTTTVVSSKVASGTKAAALAGGAALVAHLLGVF